MRGHWKSILSVLAIVFAVVAGCQKPVANTTPPAKAPAPPSQPMVAAESKTEPSSVEPAATPPEPDKEKLATSTDEKKEPQALKTEAVAVAASEPVDVKTVKTEPSEAQSAGSSDTVVAKTADPKPEKKPEAPHERFLVLTPGGPVVVDLMITLQGAGYETALQRLVEEAFKVANEGSDGPATWKKAVENPKFRSGQFGNLIAENEEQREQLVNLYDADRDGLVDREELPRFLTRNSGGGRSFSLRTSNEYRSSNRARSPTRLLLDADRDGAITVEEMGDAPASLLNRDADDDEIVVLAELKNSLDNLNAPAMMMSSRRRTNEPDTAVWLTNPAVDFSRRWGMVQFLLQELYSYGESVKPSDWPMTTELYQQVDADHDGEIKRDELAKLLEVAPHVVIEAIFDGASEKERGPRIKLRQLSSELLALKPTVRELPTRLSLQLPDVELEFFVNEDPSLSNAAEAAKQQFMALDRDKNGYLEKEEVPPQLPGLDATFESFDADSDGKVYEKEVAAYLEQRGSVARSQVRARAADQEDALFTALDSDGDGRLNSREMRESPTLLKSLDRNGDGKLQSHEIPGSMVVGFVRGNSQQDAQLFSAPAVTTTSVDSSVPRWFRGMDANSDGEISRREFFGNEEQFKKLDANGDGFIQQEESEPGK
jgi:Ca2+-binding EF-hand superfamily protein